MPTVINNRYQVIRELGQGGMGVVYLVKDNLRDNQVMALKTIRPDLLSESRLSQFKYEFAALGQLRHPNLVAVYDFGVVDESGEYFYTMEYVPGEDLFNLAARHADKDASKRGADAYTWLYEIVVQLCRALQYLHSRGFIHHDIKPSNVRITPEGQVKLMDLGLIGKAGGEAVLQLRGTLEYIAPELIRKDPVDHRADLYSLGVTLYEVVTGRLPFVGDGMAVLKQHVEATAKPLRHFVSDVPDALQTLITKLIAKGPAYRYSSADAVIQAINQLTGLDFPVETRETKQGYIQSGNLVGREFELTYLEGLLEKAQQGQGHLVLIAGAAGVGKSRLVRELRMHAQMEGVLVGEGICPEQAHAPYRPWVPILKQIVMQQKSCHPESLQLHGAALVKLMPELAQWVGSLTGDYEEPDDKESLLEAVARFLWTYDQPIIFLLEDLQHADTETIELLEYLGHRADQGRWLLCGTYRDGEISEVHPLNMLIRKATPIRCQELETPTSKQPYSLLHLALLSEADVTDFVKSMLGVSELPAGLVSRLMAETGGNVLFIESIMHSLVEEDLLQFDGKRWHIDVVNLPRLPTSIQEAAQRRLERLDAESLDLLQWAAVLGRHLDIGLLTKSSGVAPEHIFRLVTTAVQRYVLIIREQVGQTVYSFSTEQMRKAIYNTLPPEQRSRRHFHIGEALRQLYLESERAEELAWHFEQAGDPGLTLRYARMAADKARQVYAPVSAIQHYDQALALVREQADLADLETEYDLLAGREQCYWQASKYDLQQPDLEDMARIAQNMGHVAWQIEVVTRQVRLARQMGDSAAAQHVAQAALDMARQVGDPKLEAASLIALGSVCRALGDYGRGHSCFQEALRLYRQIGDRPGEADSLYWLGRITVRTGQPAQARKYFEQALALFQTLGDRWNEAIALNALAIVSSDAAQKFDYFKQSLALHHQVGNRNDEAMVYNNLALLYGEWGLYDKARPSLEQAVQILRDLPGRRSLTYVLESLGRTYLELGEHVLAEQTLEESRTMAVDIGDRWVEAQDCMALGRLALAQGRLSEARESLQRACDMRRELDTPSDLAASLAWLGATCLALGDWQAAYRCTAEAVTLQERSGKASDYPAQDVWWLHYQVLRAADDRTEGDALDPEAKTCLQHARNTMLAAIAGLSDKDLCRSYLNNIKVNRDIMTEWTIWQSETTTAGPMPSPEVSALPAMEPVAATAPDQIDERLKRVLDISVQMDETHDLEVLLCYVMDQAMELSGAERGFLVLMSEAGQIDFRVVRGIDQDEIERARVQISYTVVGTVVGSKKPILLQDALTDELFGRRASVLDLHLLSVLCVPLLSRSELVGVIYLDNRSVSGRFSQADLDLMTILANQAAIAIENARLYEETVRTNEELQAWARTMEQRVAERTVELQQANTALTRLASQLEISSRVGHHVTSVLDLDELLALVVDLILARFGYYFVSVWLVEEEKDSVALRAGTGQASEDLCAQGFRIPMNTPSIIVGVCKTGQCRSVDDVHEAPDYLAVEVLPDVRSELALPLRIGERTIGALDILSNQPAAFGSDDRMVLQTLADQISIAIRNAQLYKAERHRRLLAELLEQTGRVLSSSLDLHEMPSHILKQLDAIVPYERGLVLLQQDDVLTIVAQHGFPEADRMLGLQIPIRKHEDDAFWCMSRTHAPVLRDDVPRDSGWEQVEWSPVNRSWIGLPLISKERVIGMTSLTRRETGPFTPNEVQLIMAFAGQAAIAIENARLYTRVQEQLEELRQASEIQARLLEQVREMSTPVIPVHDRVLVLPLIGVVDSERAAQFTERLLEAVQQQRSQVVLVDITGVPVVDAAVAQAMMQAAEATRLLGAEVVLVGVRPEVAQTLVTLGLDLGGLVTKANLQMGIEYALGRLK